MPSLVLVFKIRLKLEAFLWSLLIILFVFIDFYFCLFKLSSKITFSLIRIVLGYVCMCICTNIIFAQMNFNFSFIFCVFFYENPTRGIVCFEFTHHPTPDGSSNKHQCVSLFETEDDCFQKKKQITSDVIPMRSRRRVWTGGRWWTTITAEIIPPGSALVV